MRSKVPPMLGGPSCPPRKVTERAETIPFNRRPERDQYQVPEDSEVGDPTANWRSRFKMDELSLIMA